jgi:hypothetical protein
MIVADEGNTNDVVVGGADPTPSLGPFADATDKIEHRAGRRLPDHSPLGRRLGVTGAPAIS